MKRYVVFIVSFAILYFLLQFLFGLFLTSTYQPNLSDTWGFGGSHEFRMQGHHRMGSIRGMAMMPVFFISLIAATLSYYISTKFAEQ